MAAVLASGAASRVYGGANMPPAAAHTRGERAFHWRYVSRLSMDGCTAAEFKHRLPLVHRMT